MEYLPLETHDRSHASAKYTIPSHALINRHRLAMCLWCHDYVRFFSKNCCFIANSIYGMHRISVTSVLALSWRITKTTYGFIYYEFYHVVGSINFIVIEVTQSAITFFFNSCTRSRILAASSNSRLCACSIICFSSSAIFIFKASGFKLK